MPDDDWWLTGQEAYLTGAALRRRPYRRYSESWDHDHCEFCGSKFAEPPVDPEALRVGYATLDEYRWVCEPCFKDFQHQFGWTISD